MGRPSKDISKEGKEYLEDIVCLMVVTMRDNMKMEFLMVKVNLDGVMVSDILVYGKMECKKGKEYKLWKEVDK